MLTKKYGQKHVHAVQFRYSGVDLRTFEHPSLS